MSLGSDERWDRDLLSYVHHRSTGFPEPHVDSDPEDVYDELDDHSLTALFYTGSDDDTYTDSSHISNIQERKDLHKDSLSSSDARTQDLAVSMTSKLTTKTDHGANKMAGAGSGGEFEGIERLEQHTDEVLECTALSALTARHHDGGPPVSVAQRHWIPQPFISNIGPVAHRSLWPVLATSRSSMRNEDDRCNDDGNKELD
ncbi:hypothetical protein PQX77_007396 [Marasmius sp. AFHP31]|nr:hypothetical protein PQX77_007396 [Marasmius sp. AFHP31]